MALSVSIEFKVSSSAGVTSVKSTQPHSLTDGHLDSKIGPQVYLGPIKIPKLKFQNKSPHDALLGSE